MLCCHPLEHYQKVTAQCCHPSTINSSCTAQCHCCRCLTDPCQRSRVVIPVPLVCARHHPGIPGLRLQMLVQLRVHISIYYVYRSVLSQFPCGLCWSAWRGQLDAEKLSLSFHCTPYITRQLRVNLMTAPSVTMISHSMSVVRDGRTGN